MQRTARRRLGASVAEDCRMRFRIGVHLGDVMEKSDGTVYGDGVNIAARLEALGRAGRGRDVRCGAVRGAASASTRDFDDLGEQRSRTSPSRCAPYRVPTPIRPAPAPAGADGRRRRAVDGAAEPSARDRADKPSIAVLPFNNMSGDAGAGVLRRRHHRGHHHRAVALPRAVRDLAQLVVQVQGPGGRGAEVRRASSACSTSSRAACARSASGCASRCS